MRYGLPAVALVAVACGHDPAPANPNPSAERGSIAVSWTLETADGNPTTCSDQALADAWVSISGDPVVVPCGEDERAVFSNLTFGTYPIVIRLRSPSGATRAEKIAHTVLETRGVRQSTHTFVFTDTVTGSGRLRVRWFVDGEPAADSCDRRGGVSVRISTREGSIASVAAQEPCTAGERVFENLRPGTYQLLLELIDRTNQVVSVRPTADVFVADGEETLATVSFSTGPAPLGDLLTEWTVSGGPPMDQCLANGAVQVRVTTRHPPGGETDTRTSSTSCTRGSLALTNLETSPVYRVRFNLIDPLFGIVSSTVTANVELTPAATTTVTTDLDLP